MTPSLSEAIILLSLSRGKQPPFVPPVTRLSCIRKGWIRRVGDKLEIADKGMQTLCDLDQAGKDAADRALSRPEVRRWRL